jgi:hypothetical protein
MGQVWLFRLRSPAARAFAFVETGRLDSRAATAHFALQIDFKSFARPMRVRADGRQRPGTEPRIIWSNLPVNISGYDRYRYPSHWLFDYKFLTINLLFSGSSAVRRIR